MSGRAAFKFALVFCAALGIGRLLCHFIVPARAPLPAPQVEMLPMQQAPVLVAANASTVFNPEIELARATSRMLNEHGIDRELRTVDGGIENDNIQMGHFMATDAAEGSLHKVKNGFGESVRWLPQSQQLRRGHEVTAVLASVASARARVEKAGNLNHCVYSNTYPDTEEHMYVRADGGVEHDFVLKQPPLVLDDLHNLAYSGYLQLSQGLTLWDGKTQITGSHTAQGDVHIKNAFGNTVFVLLRAKAFDAMVTNPDGGFNAEKQAEPRYRRCFTGCDYHFDFDDSGIRLSIVTPGKWLKDPARAYPVTIDPPFGPFGLADGDPPIYVGSVGTDTIIPAYSGGQKLVMAAICPTKPDNAWGIIAMPFPFTYYGVLHPVGSPLFVHLDGFATWAATNPCADTPNAPIPGGFPNAFYAYWDDLKFGADPSSGIYFFSEGTAPNRRLVIEWHMMGFARSPNAADVISFNLVLYECGNKIEIIIGRANDHDLGVASVGIQDGVRGIQYTYNGRASGIPPITPGTAVNFLPAAISGIIVTPTSSAGCIPHEVCFRATVNTPPVTCGNGPSVPPSYSFHWVFGDGGEAFTANVCHTWVIPGIYNVLFSIRDEFGVTNTFPIIPVRVCDKPEVVIGATPQGGPAPLIVEMEARTPLNPNLLLTGVATWIIERLGLNNEPGQITQIATLNGNIVSFRFDDPGTYRVTGTFTGTDVATGLATFGVGTIFIFVTDPQRTIEDSIIITQSKFTINWRSKVPPPNPTGIVPPPLPLNPFQDTLFIKGIINLPGITASDLMGRRVRVIVNGVNPVFDSILTAAGTAVQGDAATGRTGIFSIRQPSGNFVCNVRGDLYGSLGLNNITERRLHAVQFRVEIEGLFPPPGSLGPILTYDYQSTAFKMAAGSYKFGRFTKDGVLSGGNFDPNTGAPAGTGKPGGLETLISGGFLVTVANLKLEGQTVFADLRGLLARSGGDGLRPASSSDVVVSLGNFSEALNFSATPTFKTTGKPPNQKFTFKRKGGLGTAGVASMQWVNRAGNFAIKTFGLPNELVGLNPALSVQALVLGLTITPESGVVFKGTARFELNKKSETQFVRTGK